MNIAGTTTVGEVASKLPNATKIFAKYGIDFCCGGGASLADACATAGVKFDELVRAIEDSGPNAEASPKTKDYSRMSLRALMDHILTTHHVFTRNELVRLGQLVDKVVGVHGSRHPELSSVRELFRALYADLDPHLLKEENILFPYLLELDAAAARGSRCAPPPFGTVQNPVRMMHLEHEAVGDLLKRLRTVTSNYTTPADGCFSYQTLYSGLEAFEADLLQHIHLENNILFPRAIEMESAAAQPR